MIGLVTETRALRRAVQVRPASDGTSRLLATGAACASALLAEALLGASGLSAWQMLLVLVSIALWLLLVGIGFRIGVLATFAAPAFLVFVAYDLSATMAAVRSAAAIPFSFPDRTRWYLGGFAVLAALPMAMVIVSMATQAGRQLRGVLLAAGLAATAALVWPVPIFIAVAGVPSSQWILLGAAALALPSLVLAPVFSWLEASRGMRAARAMDVRDALMRVSGGTAALLASVWIVSNVGSEAARRLVSTPLEGLIVPAGWCAGGVALAIVLWALWRVPRYLYQEQLRGRFHPRAISDAIWFLLFASATAAIIDIAVAGPTLGWVSWIALGAAVAYGAVRVGTSAPLAPGASPLWIVVLQRPPWVGRAVVNLLASAWKSGPVTILAPPDAAPAIAGAHLRASVASGRLHHLFPLRSSHLVDWDDSLPPPSSWQTAPVREIYARGALWADTLSRRVTPDSVVVAVNQWPTHRGQPPITVLRLLWRSLLGLRNMRGAAVKPSDAARLRPTMSAEELAALATNESYEAVRSRLEGMQAERPKAIRHLLMLHHHDDRDLAVSLCGALAGRIDRAGMTIQPWALRLDASAWRHGVLWTVPMAFWSHAFVLAARLLDRGRGMGSIGRLWSMAQRSLAARPEDAFYDIAVLEPAGGAVAKSPLHDFFSRIVEHVEPLDAVGVGVVERVIALRTLGQDVTTTFDAQRYTGEIRWSPGLTPNARAEEIASRLLEMRIAPIEGAARPPETPASMPQPAVETPVSAPPALTSTDDAADAEADDLLDVYVALTLDVAVFRAPLMDAFDERRDMRRTIAVVAEQQRVESPRSTDASGETPNDPRSRLERADVYVLVLGPSRWSLAQAAETFRRQLDEAQRRGLPCLVFQRRPESVPESESPVYRPSADVARDAAAFLEELLAAHVVASFSDYRELVALMFHGIERVRPATIVGAHAAPAATAPAPGALLHEHEVLHASFRPDSAAIVTVAADAIARTWDAGTGQATDLRIMSVHYAEFSPDGRMLVTTGVDTAGRVWEAASGRLLAHLSAQRDQIVTAHFSPEGSRIVTASRDGTTRLWQAQSGAAISRRMRHRGAVLDAVFSPDGTRILTSGEDGVASLWDSETGERIASIAHAAPIRSTAFSPDGRLVATAGDDRTARLWDATHLSPFGMMMEHGRRVNRVVFSPDSRLVATASDDGLSHVWETTVGGASRTLRHPSPVHGVSFRRDSIGIATGCDDGHVRLWNATTGEPIGQPALLDGAVTRVEYSPDGQLLIALDGSRSVKVFRQSR